MVQKNVHCQQCAQKKDSLARTGLIFNCINLWDTVIDGNRGHVLVCNETLTAFEDTKNYAHIWEDAVKLQTSRHDISLKYDATTADDARFFYQKDSQHRLGENVEDLALSWIRRTITMKDFTERNLTNEDIRLRVDPSLVARV